MVRKALCVGCNYPSKAFGLAGAVNDAFLIADCLQKNFGFDPENVCVLHDVHPGQKKSMKVDPAKRPTRVNILQRLDWLVRNARQGDVLVFSFSGYGLQVDDMDGYQDEGLDEAILPTDFVDGRGGDYTVIVTDDIHDILMGIPPNCQVTVLMDCDHATSVVDVSGTLDGGLVNGLKYQQYCGFKVHTTKVQLAQHNREVWQEERARTVKARPRFQPMMEIDNPRKGRLPTRPAMSRSSPVAFCYSAAAHGQTSMEMQMSRVVDGKDVPKQHGVLTWCFVQALEELRYECTHTELLWAIRRQMGALKEKDLPRLDQEVLLTFSTPLSNPQTMKVLQDLPLMVGAGRGLSIGLGPQGSQMNRSIDGSEKAAIQIVPPPPPGFIGAGTGGSPDRGGPPSSGGASKQASSDRGHPAARQMDSPPRQMDPQQQWQPQDNYGEPNHYGETNNQFDASHDRRAGLSPVRDAPPDREPPPPPPPPPRKREQQPGGRDGSVDRRGIREGSLDRRGVREGSVERQGYRENTLERQGVREGSIERRRERSLEPALRDQSMRESGAGACGLGGEHPAACGTRGGQAPHGYSMDQDRGAAQNSGPFNDTPDLAPASAPFSSSDQRQGNYSVPPAPAPTSSESPQSLIPNFFNMPGLGPAPPQTRGRAPSNPPVVQRGMQGHMQANLMGGNSFQHLQPPTRALSAQQGLSFSIPSGVGMQQQAVGGPIPSATAPSFRVAPQQMVPAPGRGTSFQGQGYVQQQGSAVRGSSLQRR